MTSDRLETGGDRPALTGQYCQISAEQATRKARLHLSLIFIIIIINEIFNVAKNKINEVTARSTAERKLGVTDN